MDRDPGSRKFRFHRQTPRNPMSQLAGPDETRGVQRRSATTIRSNRFMTTAMGTFRASLSRLEIVPFTRWRASAEAEKIARLRYRDACSGLHFAPVWTATERLLRVWIQRDTGRDPDRFRRAQSPSGRCSRSITIGHALYRALSPEHQPIGNILNLGEKNSDALEHPLCPTTPGHCLSLNTHQIA